MAETPQANEGDAEEKINPVAAPQETAAEGEATAGDDVSGAEASGKHEGETATTESSPEADVVAADQAPIPKSKEPIAETGVAKGDEVAPEAPVEAAEETAAEKFGAGEQCVGIVRLLSTLPTPPPQGERDTGTEDHPT